jgi:hypothetical protein
MIRTASRACLLALPLAVLVAGCGSPASPTVTTTTTTTTTSTSTTTYVAFTETYTGALHSGQTDTNHFYATPGVITVTMTVMDPNTLIPPIGLGLGIWDATAGTCNLVVATTAAAPGSVVTGTASIAHDFCVQVWDVNGFGSTYVQNYTVTAVHFKVAGT